MDLIIQILEIACIGVVVFLPFLALAMGMDFIAKRNGTNKLQNHRSKLADELAHENITEIFIWEK